MDIEEFIMETLNSKVYDDYARFKAFCDEYMAFDGMITESAHGTAVKILDKKYDLFEMMGLVVKKHNKIFYNG